MKQKLLNLLPNQFYLLTGRKDRTDIETVLNELIAEGAWFKFSDDGERFMRCTFYEWPKPSNSFFDLVGQEGYTVEKRNGGENLVYQGKTLAIR